MTRRYVLALLGCAASIASAQAHRVATSAPHALGEYTVEFGHSIVEFSGGFAFSRVKGRFTDAKGTILYDEADSSKSSVTMVIDAKSIDTGWPHRDEHLRTDDCFDVAKYPTIVFQSDRLTQRGDGWIANGQLTMHGVTRSVAVPFHFPRAPSRSPEIRLDDIERRRRNASPARGLRHRRREYAQLVGQQGACSDDGRQRGHIHQDRGISA